MQLTKEFAEGIWDAVQSVLSGKMQSAVVLSPVDSTQAKVYKIKSPNPKKYVVRTDIKIEE